MRTHIQKTARPLRFRFAGFSLIEVMGVLAILGIVASIGATSAITRMKRTARQTEATNIANLADALRTYIQTSKTIPAASNWPSLIAEQLGSSYDQVRKTSAGFNRFFAIDPAAQLGGGIGTPLPYTQTSAGSVEPANARIVIVSTLGGTLPAFEMNPTNFAILWNTPEGAVPSVYTNYAAHASDLRIQRIDLRELFYRVILTNLDPAHQAYYSIDSIASPIEVPLNQRVERWFIASTPLNLHFTSTTLQARDLLRSDLSYVYENGRWSRYLSYGRQLPASQFTSIMQQFIDSPAPLDSTAAVTPQAVVQEFYVYLTTYATWSSGGAPFVSGTGNNPAPTLRILQDSQKRLDDFTANLVSGQP